MKERLLLFAGWSASVLVDTATAHNYNRALLSYPIHFCYANVIIGTLHTFNTDV